MGGRPEPPHPSLPSSPLSVINRGQPWVRRAHSSPEGRVLLGAAASWIATWEDVAEERQARAEGFFCE